MFNLSSANAFNLAWSKILSSGKKLVYMSRLLDKESTRHQFKNNERNLFFNVRVYLVIVPSPYICQRKIHILNCFPNKLWFLRVCSTGLFKTWWEKEKLLVMSNFFFSHSVFHLFLELSAIFIKFEVVVCKLIKFGRVQNLSFGKGLNRFSQAN